MTSDEIIALVLNANNALNYGQIFVLSFLVSVAFGMLFAAPFKILPLIGFGGGFTCIVRQICLQVDMGIVAASFIASILVSLLFVFICPRIHIPRPVFMVAGIVPIIPGKYAYLTLWNVVRIYENPEANIHYLGAIFENGVITIFVMLSIGMGLAMPALLFYRNRPVVS